MHAIYIAVIGVGSQLGLNGVSFPHRTTCRLVCSRPAQALNKNEFFGAEFLAWGGTWASSIAGAEGFYRDILTGLCAEENNQWLLPCDTIRLRDIPVTKEELRTGSFLKDLTNYTVIRQTKIYWAHNGGRTEFVDCDKFSALPETGTLLFSRDGGVFGSAFSVEEFRRFRESGDMCGFLQEADRRFCCIKKCGFGGD